MKENQSIISLLSNHQLHFLGMMSFQDFLSCGVCKTPTLVDWDSLNQGDGQGFALEGNDQIHPLVAKRWSFLCDPREMKSQLHRVDLITLEDKSLIDIEEGGGDVLQASQVGIFFTKVMILEGNEVIDGLSCGLQNYLSSCGSRIVDFLIYATLKLVLKLTN